MLDPAGLYTLVPDPPALDRPALVVTLDGFVDAGSAVERVTDHLLALPGRRLVARFDADQLVDYRSRRPALTFERDHWSGYAAPLLAVHLVEDAVGSPFLLLSGPEPDLQWERFVAAVAALVDVLGVGLVVGLAAIPMNVPHTRPSGVTAHSPCRELVRGYPHWFGSATVPGHISALLEYRLGESGHEVLGFAAHVPHYLSQGRYPEAASVLLTHLERVTGLVLPADEIQEEASVVSALVAAQLEQSPETVLLVSLLEQQYDQAVRSRQESDRVPPEDLPTAEELGDAFERFLAEQPPDHPPGSA